RVLQSVPTRRSSDLGQAITWMAVGIGSARSGNVEQAAKAEQILASLRAQILAQKNTYWANQVEVQRREVAAWMAQQSGKAEDARSEEHTSELQSHLN